MPLDSLDFVQRFGCHIALTAIGTTDNRDILDDQKPNALAVAPSDMAYSRHLFPAVITDHIV
jgi:hypothetical protein